MFLHQKSTTLESWPMTRNQPKIQASDKTKTRPHASALPPRSFPRPALTRKSDLEGVIPTDLGISPFSIRGIITNCRKITNDWCQARFGQNAKVHCSCRIINMFRGKLSTRKKIMNTFLIINKHIKGSETCLKPFQK